MKTLLITGANAGIGLATAMELAKDHALILLCRSATKANEARSFILKQHPQAQIHVKAADLNDFDSVVEATNRLKSQFDRIDTLVCNAGFMAEKMDYTQGVENTLRSCHLGHMLLCLGLRPLLERSEDARVIVLSSALHRMGKPERLFAHTQGYSTFEAYADAKLANRMFAHWLDQQKWNTTLAFSLHPGVVNSQFGDNLKGIFGPIWRLLKPITGITTEKGARTTVYLARTERAILLPYRSQYFDKCKPVNPPHPGLESEHMKEFIRKSFEFLPAQFR